MCPKVPEIGRTGASWAVLQVSQMVKSVVSIVGVECSAFSRYSDHWTFITQRLIFIIALVIYLEAGFLVTRETVAEMLGCKLDLEGSLDTK